MMEGIRRNPRWLSAEQEALLTARITDPFVCGTLNRLEACPRAEEAVGLLVEAIAHMADRHDQTRKTILGMSVLRPASPPIVRPAPENDV